MLHANRLTVKDATTDQTIAGQAGGRKVICSAKALPIYNNIVDLARNRNYWAVMIVKGIDGLTSGRLHQDNIYVEQKMSLAYGKGAFHVVLPGVTATFEELPNGKYILQHIKADTNFMEMQKRSQEPGLWRVHKNPDLNPEFQHDGMILNKDYRPIVISDMAISDSSRVAKATRDDLVKTNGIIASMVNNEGFDLHYTPGDSSIVGLKKAKDALASDKNRKIVKSAILLANTMYKARNIDGVLWYTDWGGSAVLTRALQILDKEKEIKLDNHSIFLNRPTSSPKQAIELAGKIGITALDKGKNTGLTPKEIKGHIIHTEVTGKGTAKAAGFGLATASAAIGFAGASLTTGGLVGLTGALVFVGNTVRAGAKNLKDKKYK